MSIEFVSLGQKNVINTAILARKTMHWQIDSENNVSSPV